jgi:hypothetical protein
VNAITEQVVARAPGRPAVGRRGEQSRARYPDSEGFVERDGQRLFYEVYGDGRETVFMIPTWSLIHSRHWKLRVSTEWRQCRVADLVTGPARRAEDEERQQRDLQDVR